MSTNTKVPHHLEGTWVIRRRFMFVSIGFCMAVVAYCLHFDMDSEVAQNAVNMSFLVIMSTVASYVFGATWESINRPK